MKGSPDQIPDELYGRGTRNDLARPKPGVGQRIITIVAYRLSVAYCGSGSLSKRVVYEVTERTMLVVGPGSFPL